MSARDNILRRIRAAHGLGERRSQAVQESISTYLRAHPRGPLPEVQGDLVERFRGRAESMQSTTEVVDSIRDAPGAVARHLRSHGLPVTGCVWPALSHLDWTGAGLELQPREAKGEDMVGVTGSFAAIAETGTLVLASGPDTPAGVSLLPETHIALVSARRIVAYMEDAWDLARAELRLLPRAINFISGPSRTGDIEQRMVMGAHGPYRVHVVVTLA